ncbi:hypothetical protein OQ257_11265 [Actinobacillus equuli subsp. equuli]|uniref:Uncharacterized protein n=1 Tax=Actinobacillus equuli subsp. equuli TaxID=202947 RepID=A0A9X4G8V9_ACTEU|nr:hypothetical protein [Actinobacillus equuli]MDE8035734.1 hypothetical protein [Actinobacillus equuli subsp. equuli]MDG4948427.1 hypothetical protein [Actinobacillus equuli subsp. haemolyticus]
MRDFIQFWAKFFFIMLIALGALFLFFAIDFVYIFAFFSVFAIVFFVRLVTVIIQTHKHYDDLAKAEEEKARVKYVIIQ